VTLEGVPINLDIYDSAGSEAYDRLRPLIYPNTDVFVVCFSVAHPDKATKLAEKWYPELHHHCPNTPLLVMGTEIHLREDKDTLDSLARKRMSPISHEEGTELARSIGAQYVECSAVTFKGVNQAFEVAVEECLVSKAASFKPKSHGVVGSMMGLFSSKH
jgi:small GTP-binding protein